MKSTFSFLIMTLTLLSSNAAFANLCPIHLTKNLQTPEFISLLREHGFESVSDDVQTEYYMNEGAWAEGSLANTPSGINVETVHQVINFGSLHGVQLSAKSSVTAKVLIFIPVRSESKAQATAFTRAQNKIMKKIAAQHIAECQPDDEVAIGQNPEVIMRGLYAQ